GEDGVEGVAPGLGLHDHAGAAAVGGVVDGVVAVVGPLPQVVQVHVEAATRACLADEGDVQRLQVLGEDRDDVESHAWSSLVEAISARSSMRPGGGSMTAFCSARSISVTISSTKGIMTSLP